MKFLEVGSAEPIRQGARNFLIILPVISRFSCNANHFLVIFNDFSIDVFGDTFRISILQSWLTIFRSKNITPQRKPLENHLEKSFGSFWTNE